MLQYTLGHEQRPERQVVVRAVHVDQAERHQHNHGSGRKTPRPMTAAETREAVGREAEHHPRRQIGQERELIVTDGSHHEEEHGVPAVGIAVDPSGPTARAASERCPADTTPPRAAVDKRGSRRSSVGSPNSWRNRRVAIPPTRLSSQRSVNEHRVIAPRRARTVSNRRRTAAPRRRIIPAPAAKTRASAIRRSDRKRRLAKPKLVTTSDSMITHRTSRASPWSASDRDRGGRSGSSAIKDTIIGSGADTTASTSSRWKDSAIRRAIATCSRRSSRGPCCPRRVTCGHATPIWHARMRAAYHGDRPRSRRRETPRQRRPSAGETRPAKDAEAGKKEPCGGKRRRPGDQQPAKREPADEAEQFRERGGGDAPADGSREDGTAQIDGDEIKPQGARGTARPRSAGVRSRCGPRSRENTRRTASR